MSKHTLTIQQMPVGDANNPPHDTICDDAHVIATVWDKSYTAILAAAPDMLDILTRLTEKVARANSIQHSGGRILPEDWSELYMLQNEARAALAKAQGKE